MGLFGSGRKSPGSRGGRSEGEGKPAVFTVRPKAYAMGKKKRKLPSFRKRRKDPNAERRGKAKNVKT